MALVDDNIEIVEGNDEDWNFIVKHAKAEMNWISGRGERQMWRKIFDKPYLFVVKHKTDGVLCCLNCCMYNDTYAGYTWYYTRPDKRGMGYGTPLFKYVTELMGDRIRGLFSVLNMVDKYGPAFDLPFQTEWKMEWFEINQPKFDKIAAFNEVPGIRVVNPKDVTPESLMKYYNHPLGLNFINNWIYNYPQSLSRVALDDHGCVIGYGTILLDLDGDQLSIQPLYAKNDRIALILMKHLYNDFVATLDQEPDGLHLQFNSYKLLPAIQSIFENDLGAKRDEALQPMFSKIMQPQINPDLYIFVDYAFHY